MSSNNALSPTLLEREQVLRIAKLARLELTEEEVADYQKKLGRVLEHIRELSSLEAPKDAKDAFVRHIPKDSVAFRGDSALPFTAYKALLANAPASEENCFLLPTIVEHE